MVYDTYAILYNIGTILSYIGTLSNETRRQCDSLSCDKKKKKNDVVRDVLSR